VQDEEWAPALAYDKVGHLKSRQEHDAYDATDDRGTKTGGEVVVNIVFDIEVDTAFGTNTGALTACAVREGWGGGEYGCRLDWC